MDLNDEVSLDEINVVSDVNNDEPSVDSDIGLSVDKSCVVGNVHLNVVKRGFNVVLIVHGRVQLYPGKGGGFLLVVVDILDAFLSGFTVVGILAGNVQVDLNVISEGDSSVGDVRAFFVDTVVKGFVSLVTSLPVLIDE